MAFFSYVAASYTQGMEHGAGGGAVGCLLVYPCHLLIGHVGCVILFITTLLISVLVLTGLSIKRMSRGVVDVGKRTVDKVRETAEERRQNRLYIENLREEQEQAPPYETDRTREPEIPTRESFRRKKGMPSYFNDEQYTTTRSAELAMPGEPTPVSYSPPPVQNTPTRRGGFSIEEPVKEPGKYVPSMVDESSDILPPEAKQAEETPEPPARRHSSGTYRRPPYNLLTRGEQQSKNAGAEEQHRTSLLIEETLSNFGVDAQVVHTVRGPAVTRYELRPAPGVRVKRIKELESDIAMNLAAKAVKIEAPIPGKAAVGIEVPNSDVTFVHLRALLETEEFKKAPSPLTFALGQGHYGAQLLCRYRQDAAHPDRGRGRAVARACASTPCSRACCIKPHPMRSSWC